MTLPRNDVVLRIMRRQVGKRHVQDRDGESHCKGIRSKSTSGHRASQTAALAKPQK